jgi:hypothetical protein
MPTTPAEAFELIARHLNEQAAELSELRQFRSNDAANPLRCSAGGNLDSLRRFRN